MNKNSKMRWLNKLAKTKSFIVITDTEAGMRVHFDDNDMNDVVRVSSQKAALERFRSTLNGAIREFDKKTYPKLRKHKRPVKGKRIEVKKG